MYPRFIRTAPQDKGEQHPKTYNFGKCYPLNHTTAQESGRFQIQISGYQMMMRLILDAVPFIIHHSYSFQYTDNLINTSICVVHTHLRTHAYVLNLAPHHLHPPSLRTAKIGVNSSVLLCVPPDTHTPLFVPPSPIPSPRIACRRRLLCAASHPANSNCTHEAMGRGTQFATESEWDCFGSGAGHQAVFHTNLLLLYLLPNYLV